MLGSGGIINVPLYQRARRGISYLPQEPSVFRKLTVEQNVLAVLETMPISRKEQQIRLRFLLDELGIASLSRSRAAVLPAGSVASLRSRGPWGWNRIFFAQTSRSGIDPITVVEIQRIINYLKQRGIGVLISDHNVRETLSIIDRAYIIHAGKILFEGRPHEIVQSAQVREVFLGERFRLTWTVHRLIATC